MRITRSKRNAPGGWRASQGGIPVTGIKLTYFAGRCLQVLFLRIASAMGHRLAALDNEIDRGAKK
jgi:hypothetical protein